MTVYHRNISQAPANPLERNQNCCKYQTPDAAQQAFAEHIRMLEGCSFSCCFPISHLPSTSHPVCSISARALFFYAFAVTETPSAAALCPTADCCSSCIFSVALSNADPTCAPKLGVMRSPGSGRSCLRPSYISLKLLVGDTERPQSSPLNGTVTTFCQQVLLLHGASWVRSLLPSSPAFLLETSPAQSPGNAKVTALCF